MKKIIFTMTTFALLLGSTLFAALPPLSQSARELEAIFVSPELTNKLDSSSPIKLVMSIRQNSYIVLTNNQKIIVDVIYSTSQSQNAGPLKFTLYFHDPKPLEHDE